RPAATTSRRPRAPSGPSSRSPPRSCGRSCRRLSETVDHLVDLRVHLLTRERRVDPDHQPAGLVVVEHRAGGGDPLLLVPRPDHVLVVVVALVQLGAVDVTDALDL